MDKAVSQKKRTSVVGKKLILNITPLTWVRVTQNDKIFFRIPRNKLYPSGLKRLLRIEKYNNYKIDLLAQAKQKHFELPAQGLGLTFYLPCPKSWSEKKKRKYHNTLHQSRPDLKNLLTGFEDALFSEDKYVAHYSLLCKKWVNYPTGWVELTFSEPCFEAIDMPSIEVK